MPQEFRRGAISTEWTDNMQGRTKARIVYHEGDVYIETEGNHDGVVVFTAVRIARAEFSERNRRSAVISVERRARAYAAGEVELFKSKLDHFIGDAARYDDFVRELEGLVASAFTIGHGAGIEDQEKPRWKR
jgi:hypothetical protein